MDATKLTGGRTKSCGCLHAEMVSNAFATHGLRNTRSYRIWAHMKQRCHNPRNHKFPIYGGRGITVCEAWRDSFGAFFADMGESPAGASIDRIDNERGYEPGNCRWATPMQQSNNQRTTRRFTLDGQSGSLSEWAERWGCSRDAIKLRLRRGQSFEHVANALRR